MTIEARRKKCNVNKYDIIQNTSVYHEGIKVRSSNITTDQVSYLHKMTGEIKIIPNRIVFRNRTNQ